jgi:post-segregation antitoxin (ccd killing protein)
MARLNVYVPDDLAAEARSAGLNVSGLTQEAIRSALSAHATTTWLETLAGRDSIELNREQIIDAVAAGRADLFGDE